MKIFKKRNNIIISLAIFGLLAATATTAVYAEDIINNLGSWTLVKDILEGDLLLTDQGWGKVISKEYKLQETAVYNLSVSEPNTFIADSIVAHNKGGCSISVFPEAPRNEALCILPSSNPRSGFALQARYLSTTCPFPQDVTWKIYNWDACGGVDAPASSCVSAYEVYTADTTLVSQPVSVFQHIAGTCLFKNPFNGSCITWQGLTLPDGQYHWEVSLSATGGTELAFANFEVDCIPNPVVCTSAPAVTVGDQYQCVAGNTARTWSLSFAAHGVECEPFNLQVDTTGDGVADATRTGLTGSSTTYTHTTPNNNNANIIGASAHRIGFRTQQGSLYSSWVYDEYGTDISPPGCDFTIHDYSGTCPGVAIGQTNSNYVDLKYTGTNTGCAAVASAKASLTSGGGAYAAFPVSQCFYQDLNISSGSGTFPVYARFRDSLGIEGAQCSENLTHPIPVPRQVSIRIWDDTNGDGLYSSESWLSGSKINSIQYRQQGASVWTTLSTSSNQASITLSPGNYEARVNFVNTCPNYAAPSVFAGNRGVRLNGSSTNYDGGYASSYGIRRFTISTSAVEIYMAGWEPYDAHAVSGTIWFDQDGSLTTSTDRVSYNDTIAPIASVTGTQTYTTPISQTFTASDAIDGSATYTTLSSFRAYYCAATTSYISFSLSGLDVPVYSILQSPPAVRPTYGGGAAANNDFIVHTSYKGWLQVVNGDIFSSSVNLSIPSANYLTTGIPFTVNAALLCAPGAASQSYGGGFSNYGNYNEGGNSVNWPLPWKFGDSTASFQSLASSDYSNLESGIWYFDNPTHFQNVVQSRGNYRVNRGATSGTGVAYVYVNGNVNLDNVFIKSTPDSGQGLVVLVNGDLTLGTSLGGINDSFQVFFAVNGNITVAGNTNLLYPAGQLNIKGGFIAANLAASSGSLTVNRAYSIPDRLNYPIVKVTFDPVYSLYEGDSVINNSSLLWEEI